MITRRAALSLLAARAFAQNVLKQDRPKFAITMDDGRWQIIPEAQRAQAGERILDSLGKTRAFLFAVGSYVDNPTGAKILNQWSAAGHFIGNHTYRHVLLSGKIAPADFEAEILQTEALLKQYAGFRKFFRFPALKEGTTREVRDRLRSFLAAHAYRNGAVTIDASDWYYNQRLLQRLNADPSFDPARFREPYLHHIWNRAQYYDQLSRDVLGHTVTHTLLIHYNLLNSLFLRDLLKMFQTKGWALVGADEAFADPVFARLPNTLPAGESLLWALAKETGKFENRLRYPGEDGVYEKPFLDAAGL